MPATNHTQWIDDTAGLGRLRAAALVTLLTPYHCPTSVRCCGQGLTAVDIYAKLPVIAHLRASLDGLLAQMDDAARAAARRYGAWLRAQDDPDHAPAERRNLTRAYRRAYLNAWASAYACRLLAMLTNSQPDAAPAPPPGHHQAHAAAHHDVAQLDPGPLHAAVAVLRATDIRRTTTVEASRSWCPEPGRPRRAVAPPARSGTAPGWRSLPGSRPRMLPRCSRRAAVQVELGVRPRRRVRADPAGLPVAG